LFSPKAKTEPVSGRRKKKKNHKRESNVECFKPDLEPDASKMIPAHC
jgi:hypothetical protein